MIQPCGPIPVCETPLLEIMMNLEQLDYLEPRTYSLLGNGSAVLTLRQPMTRETMPELTCALAATLGGLRHELTDIAEDAGQVEYDSWLRQLDAARR